MKDLDQTFKIKRLLAERGETISSMARKLDLPVGSVANNVYGYRQNPCLRDKVAGFLGKPAGELFNDKGAAAGAQ